MVPPFWGAPAPPAAPPAAAGVAAPGCSVAAGAPPQAASTATSSAPSSARRAPIRDRESDQPLDIGGLLCCGESEQPGIRGGAIRWMVSRATAYHKSGVMQLR